MTYATITTMTLIIIILASMLFDSRKEIRFLQRQIKNAREAARMTADVLQDERDKSATLISLLSKFTAANLYVKITEQQRTGCNRP